jgi:hypothetical protein
LPIKRTTIAILAFVSTLGAGMSEIGAHNTSYPTTIGFRHFEGYPGNALLSGRVESPKSQCVPSRTVKLIGERPSGERIVADSTRSSRKGAYGLHGEFNGDDEIWVKVTQRNVGPRGHSHICESETVLEYPTPP